MSFDLSQLAPGVLVELPGVSGPVTLVAVQPGPFWKLHFDGPHGPDKLTLSEDELAQIVVVERLDALPFDGDPHLFRMAVEAHRIEVSFAHDMAALAVSNIQPLPHQLEAVYDHFLREPRLRFLLADDPGAGKTIMAGLYMKELVLRHAGDPILVVTPANLRVQWARELAERFDLRFTQLEAGNFDAHPGENPWDVYDYVIVSRDFLRTERVIEAFANAERRWDLAVVDEAHGYTISVDGKGFIKSRSERYKAAEQVAKLADRMVLLTATPHSGRGYKLVPRDEPTSRLTRPPSVGSIQRVAKVSSTAAVSHARRCRCDASSGGFSRRATASRHIRRCSTHAPAAHGLAGHLEGGRGSIPCCYIAPRTLTSGEIAMGVFLGLWAFVISVASIITSLLALGLNDFRP